MIGKSPNRFNCLTKPFYIAASKVGNSASNYCKQAAIYQLDLEGDATWKDVGAKIKERISGTIPSNIMQ